MSRGASYDIQGTPVSEEEVSKGLGFSDVFEFRRWQTETANKLSNTEYELKKTTDEMKRFQSLGKKLYRLLQKVHAHFNNEDLGGITLDQLKFAVAVNTNKEIDWKNELKWLEENNG